jgi:hypothetical protein
MPEAIQYEDTGAVFSIRFATSDLELRDLSIATGALHRAFNATLTSMLVPDISETIRLAARTRFDDPLFVSLHVEELRRDSFFARCRIRVSPQLRRGIAASAVGGFIASSAIWAIGAAVYGPNHVPPPPQPPAKIERMPDVAPGIRKMVTRLNETGRAWELQLRDDKTGYEIIVRSR